MSKDDETLESYAARQQKRSGPIAYVDTLPDEIRAQIRSADRVPAGIVVRWLRDLGYSEATLAKIQHWRRSRASGERDDE